MSVLLLSLVVGGFIGYWGTRAAWSSLRIFAIAMLAGLVISSTISALSKSDGIAVTRLREATLHVSMGTAALVQAPSGKSYILTNWHVCNAASWANKLRANSENGELFEGFIIKADMVKDLCAIRVYTARHALSLGSSIHVGDSVYTRGYPLGVLSETSGKVMGRTEWDFDYPIEDVGECKQGSAPIRDGRGNVAYCRVHYVDNVTDMYSRPGSSGSPVVNTQGELVGVMSSWDSSKDAGGMVKLEHIQAFFKDL